MIAHPEPGDTSWKRLNQLGQPSLEVAAWPYAWNDNSKTANRRDHARYAGLQRLILVVPCSLLVRRAQRTPAA